MSRKRKGGRVTPSKKDRYEAVLAKIEDDPDADLTDDEILVFAQEGVRLTREIQKYVPDLPDDWMFR